MSRPNTAALTETTAPQLSEPAHETNNVSPELVRRVVFEVNATGSELAQGSTVAVSNPDHVFKPSMPADLTEAEQKEFMSRDYTQGIVTSVKLKSVGSNCPETVTVGLNLFKNNPQVANSQGWLYARQVNDMSDVHAHVNDGFANLVTILPHERQRPDQVVYEPENVMNSRYIQQYGGYTLEKLKQGIVQFPDQDYCYVPESHVVTDIVKNNWESLGVNLEAEAVREGQYVKLAKSMVDNCISQLYSNVISQIPFTSFADLGARFQANTEGADTYKVVCEMEIKYRFP